MISARLIARNTALNLGGQVVPLVVGFASIPVIVRGLGVERFGVLAVAWILLNYFSLFDLGIGRATTKFAAEAHAAGKSALIAELVWTSITIQLGVGLIGALGILAGAGLLVSALHVPAAIAGETGTSIAIIAFAVPVTMIAGTARSTLEVAQRFDLANLVSAPTNALTYLLPAIGASLGLSLPGIVGLLVVNRAGAALAYGTLGRHVFPELWSPRRFSRARARMLLGFGSWVTVTSVIGPVIVYADRFLIGAALGIAALGYYAAPFDLLTRLWLVPTALVMTLFPALSGTSRLRPDLLASLYARALAYLFLVLAPIVFLLIVFADDLLSMWIGADFARQGGPVLRVLALGILVNALAQLPFALVQAVGRPDLPAKLHAVELVPYVVALMWLIAQFGLVGAAVGWAIRATVDGAILLLMARRLLPHAGEQHHRRIVARYTVGTLAVGMAAVLVLCATGSELERLIAAPFALAALMTALVFFLLGPADRALARRLVLRRSPPPVDLG